MNGSKCGGGEGLPSAIRAQVALGLQQRFRHPARRADVGWPVGLALLALGVRLQVREQDRAVAVQVWRPDLAVEAV